jgi:hypothetical protein
MTLANTKAQMIHLLKDRDNRVIAMSGKWGTGKTHLWESIRDESNDKRISNSLYISLFGLSSIDQVKLKLLEAVIPTAKSQGPLVDGLKSLLQAGSEVSAKQSKALNAVNALTVSVIAPALFRDKLIVIDDIERKHKKLGIDEVLGFIDEYSKRQGARFILILNDDKLSARGQQKKLWATLREKLIDHEIKLSTSAEEAFSIASMQSPTQHAAHLERACIACSLTNIRIIRKIIKTTNEILADRALDDATLARVIPSLVLFPAIHYRGLDDGPDMQFALNIAQVHITQGLNRQAEAKDDEAPRRNRWLSLMQELGIYGCDEFEQHLVDFLESGLLDGTELDAVLNRYERDTEALQARQAVSDFLSRFYWDHRVDEDSLRKEAARLQHCVCHLNALVTTELHSVVKQLPGGEELADTLVDDWVAAYHARNPSVFEDPNPFNDPLHPKIKAAFDKAQAQTQASTKLVDASMHIIENTGWSSLQEVALQRATVDDFDQAIRGIQDTATFRRFMSRMMQMARQKHQYEPYFGEALDRFVDASKSIANDDASPRLAGIVRRALVSAGLEP